MTTDPAENADPLVALEEPRLETVIEREAVLPPTEDLVEISDEPSDVVETEDLSFVESDQALEVSPTSGRDEKLYEIVHQLGVDVTSRLDRLQSQFDREVRAEATREKMVDRLHAELQEYKNGLLLGALRPVLVDLIQLFDDIGKMVDATEATDGEVNRLLNLMRGYQQGIADILYRQGVEPYQVEGDLFDPRRQRAVTTLTTDDAELNKRVATRHRPGFQAEDKVIRPEVVTVYAFKK